MVEAKIVDITFSNSGDRNDVRKRVINEFLKEVPGTGSGELQSKYFYYVETLKSGNRIYLERPANLHNGFDFVINVENVNFSQSTRVKYNPSHNNILEDLIVKKNESSDKYQELFDLITKVYNCEEIDENINLTFNTGYSVELILKVIKWFFIEQDIRYWNYSGRAMFMSEVPKP